MSALPPVELPRIPPLPPLDARFVLGPAVHNWLRGCELILNELAAATTAGDSADRSVAMDAWREATAAHERNAAQLTGYISGRFTAVFVDVIGIRSYGSRRLSDYMRGQFDVELAAGEQAGLLEGAAVLHAAGRHAAAYFVRTCAGVVHQSLEATR